jgi:N6-adenosine-specific RNA methylase IME4
MKLPALYSNAKQALAKAVRIDEVKRIRDVGHAIRVLAFQARDGALASDATALKMRATRRLGQLMDERRKDGRLAKGTRGRLVGPGRGKKKTAGLKKPHRFAELSLAEQNIDKNLAKRAREEAAKDDLEFEREVVKACEQAVVLAERGDRTIYRQVQLERRQEILARRHKRHCKIAAAAAKRAPAIENVGPFALVYADPPWVFEAYGRESATSMPDDHYPTLSDDEIVAYMVGGKTIPEFVHDDCSLFMWCTSANIERALDVLRRLGFRYSSQLVWDKQRTGTGQIFLNQHEVLLYGVRGEPPKPVVIPSSVFSKLRTAHSEKPPEIRQMIEAMFPHYDARHRIELFARGRIEGWSTDGFEADASYGRAKDDAAE